LLDARIATSKIHGFAAAAQSPVARVARIVASSHGLDLELTINWSNADSNVSLNNYVRKSERESRKRIGKRRK